MKSATEGQFRELLAKLLTGIDCEAIDSEKIQKAINNPTVTIRAFIDYLNEKPSLFNSGLVISPERSCKNAVTTSLESGDILCFYTKDNTVSIYRPSLKLTGKRILFNLNSTMFDDKAIFRFESNLTTIHACELLASFCGLTCRQQERNVLDMFYVEFR